MPIMPIVIEQTSRGERQYDIYSRLLKDRIVFLGHPIDDAYANIIIAQFLFLSAEDPEKEINLYINCPGGYITSGLAIYDTMQYIQPDVRTICIGQAGSMGSLLLAAGTAGKRAALPNARIVMHQPLGGASGQSRDIEIQAKEILSVKDRLNQIYSKHTGQPVERIEKDTDRDFYITAEEAVKYGLIDNIIEPLKVQEKGKQKSKTKK